MRTLDRTTRFRRDYKRERKTDPVLVETLAGVVALLAADAELPASLHDHPLVGNMKGYRDCHVRPDLVLIYGKGTPDILKLVRLGSHSELFG